MTVTITEEQRRFLVDLLQDQAEIYLKLSDDSLVTNRRTTNDLLFIFDRPSEKQTRVGWSV